MRVKQHGYRFSSIYQRYVVDHDKLPSEYDSILKLFERIYSNAETINLKTAETICIQLIKPYINVKFSELYDLLGLL